VTNPVGIIGMREFQLSIQAISTELEFSRPGQREIAMPESGAKHTTACFVDNHIILSLSCLID